MVNDVSAPGVGFDHDTNAVTILGGGREHAGDPADLQRCVADAVLDRVIAHHNEKRSTT